MNDQDALLTAVRDHLRNTYPLKDHECETRQDLTVPASHGELFVAVAPGTYGDGGAPDEASMIDKFEGFQLGLTRRISVVPDDRQYVQILAETTQGLKTLSQEFTEILRRDRWQIMENANARATKGTFVEPFRLPQATADVIEVDPDHFNADPTAELPVGALLTLEFNEARYMRSLLDEAPVADFAADQTTVERGNPVQFWNYSTGKWFEYSWRFEHPNPAAASNEVSPSWIYQNPGLYTVRLFVQGPGGTHEALKNSYITVT